MTMRQFKVMWKMPRQKTRTGDFGAYDVKSLLNMLVRSEGVTVADAEEMHVHEIMQDGSVRIIIEQEHKSNVVIADFKQGSTALVPTGKSPVQAVRSDYTPRKPHITADRSQLIISEVRHAIEKIKNRTSSHPAVDYKKLERKSIAGDRWHTYAAPH